MGCLAVLNFACDSIVGDTFVGHRFTFLENTITDLKVLFFDNYGNKIPGLEYTIENGWMVRDELNDPLVWEMKSRIPDVDPGVYHYKVRVIYDDGNEQTIIKGIKKFTK